MGNKRRILRNPKFKHLKKIRFGSDISSEQQGNSEEQEKLEEQEPIIETPVLNIVEEPPPVEEIKPEMTAKKPTFRKSRATKASTRKPRARKTTVKRAAPKAKVE